MRRAPLRACLLVFPVLGAPGTLLSASCQPSRAQATARDFDEARAWRDLETIVGLGPRPVGSEALERARAYLERELTAAGLEPVRETFTAETPRGPIEMANVYADLVAPPREGRPARIIALVSHIDTKILDPKLFDEGDVFVGANDGGSSTAVLLELARVLAARGPYKLTIRFLFVDGEESIRWDWSGEDNRYGSRHHVRKLREEGRTEDLACAVVIDLVGDRDLKLFREVNSDSELLELFFRSARRAGLGKHVDGKRQPLYDDHLSFHEIDVPAIDLIDFDYGPGNAYWHDPADTLDKCSAESLGIAGRIVLLGLPDLEKRFAPR